MVMMLLTVGRLGSLSKKIRQVKKMKRIVGSRSEQDTEKSPLYLLLLSLIFLPLSINVECQITMRHFPLGIIVMMHASVPFP